MSELVLLDTDILSMFFRGDPSVVSRMEEYASDHEKVYLSIITYYEALSGLRHIGAGRQIELFLEFCFLNEVLPLTDSIFGRKNILPPVKASPSPVCLRRPVSLRDASSAPRGGDTEERDPV